MILLVVKKSKAVSDFELKILILYFLRSEIFCKTNQDTRLFILQRA